MAQRVEVSVHPSGVSIYTIRSGENEFRLSSFGGQLLGWNKGGTPVLFDNCEAAIIDGKTAYRGGAPICFPYFGRGALLPSDKTLDPQHGGARTSVWDVEVQEPDQTLVFRTEQPSAEGHGPTVFRCEIAYVFSDDLEIHASIVNVGERPSPFQFVVHSYWATEDPAGTIVDGLGARYLDNRADLAASTDPDPSGAHLPPFDRVYPDAESQMEVTTESYRVAITTEGCAGAVLWNPGENHGIRDLKEPSFVCVESGIITPAPVLEPGETRQIRIVYRAEILSSVDN